MERKKILKASRERLEASYTLKEITAVMEHLPRGKMAGPNKIPNAVYRNLAIYFAPKFRDLMNEIVATGRMPAHTVCCTGRR